MHNCYCDLLEKSYICSIANNMVCLFLVLTTVVICLKNRTFAVSQTTYGRRDMEAQGCDLLEKSYICSIANNSPGVWARNSPVVICLKNRTFAVSQTTQPKSIDRQEQL